MEGIGASEGAALGPVHRVERTVVEPNAGPRPQGTADEDEVRRFQQAAAEVTHTLGASAQVASGIAREMLSATAQMAADPGFAAQVERAIAQDSLSAERAVWVTADKFSERLQDAGGYMGQRATDVLDVRDRILAKLTGKVASLELPRHPVVLVARNLSPADTSQLDATKVLAIVTVQGGPQAHSAILARSLAIPAVVGADAEVLELPQGSRVFVDGDSGLVTGSPSQEQVEQAYRWARRKGETPTFSGRGLTADGRHIALLANVGSAADAQRAADAGAEGIGLLRTEFLFLERDDEPSVEEQAAVYEQVFAAFPGKKVVIRTLDAGSDKPIPFITAAQHGGPAEPNPALGMRGFRTAEFAGEVLTRQLQAIALADSRTEAEVQVMAPMITTAGESAAFADLVHNAGLTTAGVMVETPQAALCARAVLAPVEFASIGTNDLTQYALAFDRELAEYRQLQSASQPAVLTLIGATCLGATAAAADTDGQPRPVGVCGEAAADPELAVALVGLGVDSLSMSIPALEGVADALGRVTVAQARDVARIALAGSVFQDVLLPPSGTTGSGAEAARVTTAASALTDAADPGTVQHGDNPAIETFIPVTAPAGLHARPAAVLAKAVQELNAQVTIYKEDSARGVSAGSIMEMMTLGVEPGETIRVVATGPDAAQAVAAVREAAGSTT